MAEQWIEYDYDEPDDREGCPNCAGTGLVADCFEDTCCGADCDPEDPYYCCNPRRCDWCRPSPKPLPEIQPAPDSPVPAPAMPDRETGGERDNETGGT